MRSTVFAPFSLIIALTLTGCSSATDSGEAAPQQSSSAEAVPTESASVAQPSFCEPASAIGREATSVGTPSALLEKKQFTLTLVTNCGDFEITADAAAAPATVTTIGFLANNKYYDQTVCHRLTTTGIFVLQCGDPTATGAGGPGFTFKDENLPAVSGVNYPKGTVAMANSGPNTNGSQFFLVYKDTTLPPNYTIWGTITKGLDTLEKISDLGTVDGGPDGNPKFPIEIRSARLS